MLLEYSKQLFKCQKGFLAFFHQYKKQFFTDFQLRSEIFNSHFANHCSSIKNYSRIPSKLLLATEKSSSSVKFSEVDILSVTRKLDPSKAHGHKISNRKVKVSEKTICESLHTAFYIICGQWRFSINMENDRPCSYPACKKLRKELQACLTTASLW